MFRLEVVATMISFISTVADVITAFEFPVKFVKV